RSGAKWPPDFACRDSVMNTLGNTPSNSLPFRNANACCSPPYSNGVIGSGSSVNASYEARFVVGFFAMGHSIACGEDSDLPVVRDGAREPQGRVSKARSTMPPPIPAATKTQPAAACVGSAGHSAGDLRNAEVTTTPLALCFVRCTRTDGSVFMMAVLAFGGNVSRGRDIRERMRDF